MIRPEEAARFNDEDDIKILAEAEKTVDAALKKRYHTDCSVTFKNDAIPLRKNYRLQGILFARYREAGWEIKSGSDQRDNESWVTFKAKKPHRSPISGSLRGMSQEYADIIRGDGNQR
jgi:hypothetical protein